MDSYDIISLSKIATIIADQKIILTDNNSVWDKILSNAGQSNLFEEYKKYITPFTYNGIHQNKNPKFDEFYSAIKSILNEVYQDGVQSGEFHKLMASIIESIDLNIILDVDIDELNEGIWDDYVQFSEYLRNVDEELANKTLNLKTKQEYQEFVLSLQVLNLDVQYKKKKLVLTHFTELPPQINRNVSSIMQWLTDEHSDIANSYKQAIENYADGRAESCITNCRSIITGIFTYYKDDAATKWSKGLQNVSTDTFIKNVELSEIISGSTIKRLQYEDPTKQFKFPRFMTIYSLYSLTSDLGAHTTEAPKIAGQLYPEVTTMNDALLCLRMTEDVLIWVRTEKRN